MAVLMLMDANHEGLLFSWFQVCLGPTTRQAGPTGTMLALQPLIPFLLTSFLFVNQLQQCHAVYASGDNVFFACCVKKAVGLSTSCNTMLKELSVIVLVEIQIQFFRK